MRACVLFILMSMMLVATDAWAERRSALVIGNAEYTRQPPLRGTIQDAHAMNAKLEALGFETVLKLNLEGDAFRRAIDDFGGMLNRSDVGLVYFSGHGAQGGGGQNHLIPVDAQALSPHMPTVQGILRMMERASNRVNIIILDACRNLPAGFAAGRRGLAPQELDRSFRPVPVDRVQDVIAIDDENERFVFRQRQGNAILYAAAPGELSWEGHVCPQYGGHGCFTGELLQVLDKDKPSLSGLGLYEVFRRIRAGVLRSTRDRQAPWFNVAMTGEFYFVPHRGGGDRRVWRVGEMIPSHMTDPEEIERFLEIRRFQARRLAEAMDISFGKAAWTLYGHEAGRLGR
jgi:hypothetical protein